MGLVDDLKGSFLEIGKKERKDENSEKAKDGRNEKFEKFGLEKKRRLFGLRGRSSNAVEVGFIIHKVILT